jgi:hypothetical protein
MGCCSGTPQCCQNTVHCRHRGTTLRDIVVMSSQRNDATGCRSGMPQCCQKERWYGML